MHPPASRRCQIYFTQDPQDEESLQRCPNEGTHWEKWSGCECPEPDHDVCVTGDFYSWECDGVHEYGGKTND